MWRASPLRVFTPPIAGSALRRGDWWIDGDRICLWTFSAGGSLAQIGLDPKNKISCVVACYGLGQAGPHIALHQHAATMPPMLIVRAGRDNPGLNNAIDTFALGEGGMPEATRPVAQPPNRRAARTKRARPFLTAP